MVFGRVGVWWVMVPEFTRLLGAAPGLGTGVCVCSIQCWQNCKVLCYLTMPLYWDIHPLTDISFKVLETKHKLGAELCGMLGARSWSGSTSGSASGPHVLLPEGGGGEQDRKEVQV